MEVAGHMTVDPDPRLHLVVIDHFTMNDHGEIVRAVYYFRGNMDAVKRAAELEAELARLKNSR
jgi:hypothetical protein